MGEFAEQEIVIPDGPFKGESFRMDRQPFSRLWFEAMDSERWNRFVCTGPTQTGKTMIGFIIPILYRLFEVGETVICAVPKMDMAGDKWREDILPAIMASRYRDLLPTTGGGSKGGQVTAVRFKNGATLRFMSGGGDDKSRAGFTARVLVVTETDGMDEAGGTSREADKITQLEARTRAYGDRKRIYLECTVSTTRGRTWQEYTASTASRIVVRCPHCRTFISPERDHLAGWQDADTKGQAKRESWYFCPQCGEKLDEADRRTAHKDMRLLHQGQEIDADGQVTGEAPDTNTLGFRWNAFNNFFLTAGDVGQDEWTAAHATDEDNAQKEIHQFVWAMPWDPDDFDLIELDPEQVKRRIGPNRKGIVPEGTKWLTGSFDLGQVEGSWWMVLALLDNGRRHVVDYGNLSVPKFKKNEAGLDLALLGVMGEFRDVILSGFYATTGEKIIPVQAWMDSRWKGYLVRAFCKEQEGNRFRPILGFGASQHEGKAYRKPTKRTRDVRFLGQEYHAVRREGLWEFQLNSDHWKTQLQQGLDADVGSPGSVTLYESADKNEHKKISRHFTAEKQIEKARDGKSPQLVWELIRKANHYLDCGMIGYACGHYCEESAARETETVNAADWFSGKRR